MIYVAALQDVPRDLYEAAELDGMGPTRRFTHVTLPMISPVILFNVVVLAINALQIFAVPYIMFRTKDGQKPRRLLLHHVPLRQRLRLPANGLRGAWRGCCWSSP